MTGQHEAHSRKVFYELSDAKLAHHQRQQREAIEPAQRSVDGGSFDVEGIVSAELKRTSVAAKRTDIGVGKTAPPWRVGPSAPRRWPAEPEFEPNAYSPLQLLWNEFYNLSAPAAKVAWLELGLVRQSIASCLGAELAGYEINVENLVAAWSNPAIVKKWKRRWRNIKRSTCHRAKTSGDHLYGPRPCKVKWAQAIASIVVAPRLSDDRYNSQRLRDFKAHIHEQACRSGSAFENTGRPPSIEGLCQYIIRDIVNHEVPWVWKEIESREQRLGHFPSRAYAHGIRWLEKEGIEQFRQHDQLRWCIDSPGADADNTKIPEWLKPYARQVEGIRARGRDSMIAVDEGFRFEEEVANTVARRRKKPLRERRKPGPKPIGDHTMTDKERARRYRAKKLKATVNPNGRDRPGIIETPLPRELMVSGTPLTDKETHTMSDIVEMKPYRDRRVLRDLRAKTPLYVTLPLASIERIRDIADEILRGVYEPPAKS